MIMGDLDFFNIFTKCDAVSYIFGQNEKDSVKLIELFFVFKNKREAEAANNVIKRWIDAAEGDTGTVEINFIEEESKIGYKLCINQRYDDLMKRNCPEYLEEWTKPIVMATTFFKSLKNTSGYYYKFKDAVKNNTYNIKFAFLDSNYIASLNNDNIIKNGNDINFFKENEIPEESHLYVNSHNKKIDFTDINEIYKATDDGIEEERIKNIKYFFPITYEKIENEDYLSDEIKELMSKYEKSEILQAICNIILDFRIKKQGLRLKSSIEILDYLLNSYEDYNSLYPNKPYMYSLENIEKQIVINKNIDKQEKKIVKENPKSTNAIRKRRK